MSESLKASTEELARVMVEGFWPTVVLGTTDAENIVQTIATALRSQQAAHELTALKAIAEVAKRMPRSTPSPGGCATVHDFKIDAGTVWEFDRALNRLDSVIAEIGGGK